MTTIAYTIRIMVTYKCTHLQCIVRILFRLVFLVCRQDSCQVQTTTFRTGPIQKKMIELYCSFTHTAQHRPPRLLSLRGALFLILDPSYEPLTVAQRHATFPTYHSFLCCRWGPQGHATMWQASHIIGQTNTMKSNSDEVWPCCERHFLRVWRQHPIVSKLWSIVWEALRNFPPDVM